MASLITRNHILIISFSSKVAKNRAVSQYIDMHCETALSLYNN